MMNLTYDEILNMPAGREMDVLIEHLVFGHEVVEVDDFNIKLQMAIIGETKISIPPYSSHVVYAWKVVDKMPNSSWVEVRWDGRWCEVWFDDGANTWEATANTAPLAICRAALLAVITEE